MSVISGNSVLFALGLKTQSSPTRSTSTARVSIGKSRVYQRLQFRTRATVDDCPLVSKTHEEEALSFYDLLGISENGSLIEIKQAYKQMARKYHPDVSPPDLAEEYTKRFIQVHEAYETLSDPNRRALYDRDLAMGIRFAFTARKRHEEDLQARSEWRYRWQDQVAELKMRSAKRDSEDQNMSWGARMRRQRRASSAD